MLLSRHTRRRDFITFIGGMAAFMQLFPFCIEHASKVGLLR
jgi:hypothetical protein